MGNEVDPLVNFGRLYFFGNPHHGIVKNGTLTKSDSSTLTWSQPTNGDTFLVQFDGIGTVERTSEEAAADAIAHYQWINYAIISGGGYQLYGKNIISPWLYRADDGGVWRVTVAANGATSLEVKSELFGRVSSSSDPVINTQTVDISSAFVGVAGAISDVILMDTKPDGTEAAFGLYVGDDHALVVLSASGIPSLNDGLGLVVGLTILKNSDDVYVENDANVYINEPAKNLYFEMIPDGTYTDIYGCSMDKFISSTRTTGGSSGSFLSLKTDRESKTGETTDRTLYFWAFYDQSGPVKVLSWNKREEYLADFEDYRADAYTGGYVDSKGVSDGLSCAVLDHYTHAGTITHEYNSGKIVFGNTKFSILIDDVEIDSVEVDIRHETHYNTVNTFTPSPTTPPSTIIDGINSENSVDSGESMIVTVDGAEVHASVSALPSSSDYIPYHSSVINRDPELSTANTDKGQPDIDILQISNKLVCLMRMNRPALDFTYKQHVSPKGGDATEITKATLSEENGTFNPVSGDIVRNQADPVCYV